jgi:phage-related protein
MLPDPALRASRWYGCTASSEHRRCRERFEWKPGFLLRRVQEGETLSIPESHAMPSIGQGCHELRITDTEQRIEWRVIYCIGKLAIAILDVFEKKTKTTPQNAITNCRRRFAAFKKEDTP